MKNAPQQQKRLRTIWVSELKTERAPASIGTYFQKYQRGISACQDGLIRALRGKTFIRVKLTWEELTQINLYSKAVHRHQGWEDEIDTMNEIARTGSGMV